MMLRNYLILKRSLASVIALMTSDSDYTEAFVNCV